MLTPEVPEAIRAYTTAITAAIKAKSPIAAKDAPEITGFLIALDDCVSPELKAHIAHILDLLAANPITSSTALLPDVPVEYESSSSSAAGLPEVEPAPVSEFSEYSSSSSSDASGEPVEPSSPSSSSESTGSY
jgi:hypothetical protein